MYEYISGKIIKKEPTSAIIDVHGIGYRIYIPLSTYETLGQPGENVKLLTHFKVREDDQSLYGFASESERDLFRLLIDVSGIGARTAISILSGASVNEFKQRILNQDVKALTLIPGIGKKTAQRIIVELAEKLPKMETGGSASSTTTISMKSQVLDEAVRALVSLGYNKLSAEKSVTKAAEKLGNAATLEQYIKAALNMI
ncbi:MAG: Holliday junction branch migration protein RuvA [Candidatus Marinimicrobia bacterium]|nr:Holliday junction branch migration protein RuvA [Candidatus Neomarinimicrobiota bacterium]